jgi:anaerobic magnesium-protoporphyrin IX monomethyl ester cyclase
MTRILFGQSYYLRFDPKLLDAMQPYPPLGTLYAAAYLRARGHDVGLFDAMLAESEDRWAGALRSHRPAYAVLFEDNFNYLSKMCLLRMRQAAFRMIALAKDRGCTVILCGADATDHPGTYLARGADFVIRGEGEEALLQLVDSLEGRSGSAFERIPGLSWRDGAGAERSSAAAPPLTNLDAIPFPAWDLVDASRYRRLWRARHGRFSVNMVTTRGCPYHCNWCAKPIWGQRYNSRSPENVVAELEWLEGSLQPDHVWFADDIFGLKPGWVEEFGKLAARRGAAIPFKCQMRADLVRSDTVAGLQAARCETVWLGAESGSQKILDAMEKGITIDQIRRARRLLGEAGIQVGFFLQFGYPGEDRADIEMTVQMVRDLKPDDIGVSVSYPLPGTRFYERVAGQLGEKRNWNDSDDLAMLFRGAFSEPFYRSLYRALHAEFRMRKALRRFSPLRHRGRAADAGRWRALCAVPKHWLTWRAHRRRLERYREIPERLVPASETS